MHKELVKKEMLTIIDLTEEEMENAIKAQLSQKEFDTHVRNNRIAGLLLDTSYFELMMTWREVKESYSPEDIKELKEMIELTYRN
jgi:hypothetical protein